MLLPYLSLMRAFDSDDLVTVSSFNKDKFEVEVPGFKKGDLTLSFKNGYFRVKGKRKTADGSEASINKSLYLGNNIKTIDTVVEDGLLTATINKSVTEVKIS